MFCSWHLSKYSSYIKHIASFSAHSRAVCTLFCIFALLKLSHCSLLGACWKRSPTTGCSCCNRHIREDDQKNPRFSTRTGVREISLSRYCTEPRRRVHVPSLCQGRRTRSQRISRAEGQYSRLFGHRFQFAQRHRTLLPPL